MKSVPYKMKVGSSFVIFLALCLTVVGLIASLNKILSYDDDLKLDRTHHNHNAPFVVVDKKSTSDKDSKRNIAVIHMGIHKTGTTSIQTVSAKYKDLLKSDGYEMPWVVMKEKHGRSRNQSFKPWENQVNFASCFLPLYNNERNVYPCDPNLLLYGTDIATRKQNLFISSESMSGIDTEGVKMLSSYLSQWDDAVIIVYYRRFYSWIASVYNQRYKKHIGNRPSVIDFVESYIDKFDDPTYTMGTVNHLKEHFSNIVVQNYHSGDSLQSFYCDAMPNANHMCSAIIDGTINRVESNKRSSSMYYEDLAVAAMKAGLISFDLEKANTVVDAVRNHQEKVLDLTSTDFETVCLPSNILDKLWHYSITAELMFVPEVKGNKTLAESNLKSNFELLTHTTLCKIDTEATLKKQTWVSFFKDFSQEDKSNMKIKPSKP